MSDERGVIRRIAWRELFPWLLIARALRMSFSPTVLLIATLGVFVSSIGWRIAPSVFFTEQGRREAGIPSDAFWTGATPSWQRPLPSQVPSAYAKYLPGEPSGILDGFFALAEPVRRLLSYELSLNEAAYYVFGFLWSLAVWALVGGFITRRAVVQAALDDAPGIVETGQFAARRWIWYFLAPLYPLLGVLILVLLHVPLGWIMRLGDGGVLAAGIAWLLVLIAGIAAAWLLLGTLLGWPLMWGALSADREGDAFDAFSRSFSYVYGRPLHYLFYVIVAALLGALGYAAAEVFIRLLYEFGFWAVSWGASGERVAEIRRVMAAGERAPIGHQLLNFWGGVAFTFLAGYVFAYFWNSAGIIYLLLRYDVDEKEMDEVYLPEEEPRSGPPAAAPAATTTPSATAPPTDLAQEE